MNTATRLFLAFVVLLSAAVGSTAQPMAAHAQDELIEDPDREARLHAWMDYRADDASTIRTMGWVTGGMSLAMLGLSGALLGLATTQDDGSTEPLYWAGGVGLIAGSLVLASSIANLLGVGLTPELFIEIDEAESPEAAIVQMETLLQVRAQLSRSARMRNVIFGGAYLAIAGGTFIAIAASNLEETPALMGYALAGGLALGGALNLIVGAFESDAERDWADYNAGLRPAREGELEVALSPLVVEGGGGLTLVGSF